MTTQSLQFRPIEAQAAHPSSQRWSASEVTTLFESAFYELLYQAQTIHRRHFQADVVQLSTLLSIKTGGCSEDCQYCPQSAYYDTGVENQPLLSLEAVREAAQRAKACGATRFCLGAAWRGPDAAELAAVVDMVREIRALGLETCATLGLLKAGQAEQLRAAGLDYYNHNIDTAPEKYNDIISTRDFEDRLNTLGKVRAAGLNVCCGGIVGLGESRSERAQFLSTLANLDPPPESVPINQLVRVEGTPLAAEAELDWTEFVRTIAVARILMPTSFIRLSAGRQQMSEAVQAFCFLAGANSIFYGETLLTTGNPAIENDRLLFSKLDLRPLEPHLSDPLSR